MFYGPKNKNLAQTFPYRPGALEVGRFNGSLPTKVIIHGFGSSCNRVWAHEMREALLFTVSARALGGWRLWTGEGTGWNSDLLASAEGMAARVAVPSVGRTVYSASW